MLLLSLSMPCNLGMPAHVMASALMSSFQKKDVWLPTNLTAKPMDSCPSRANFNAHRPPCWCGPLLVAPAPFLLSQDHWPLASLSPSYHASGPSTLLSWPSALLPE